MNLSERSINLQSWWVASELLRRHPELELVETHPGGGLYDCLTIIGERGMNELHIDLNRVGRMHVHTPMASRFDRTRWGIEHPVEWSTERDQTDRRLIPRFLEDAVGLASPTQTPVSTPKSLAFRVIYQLLLFALNEEAEWDARNAQLDSSGMMSDNELPYFDNIESAQDALHRGTTVSGQAISRYDFWGMLRDGRCLGLIQTDGTLHLPGHDPVPLMSVYNANKRDILPTAMEIRDLLTA